MADKKPLSFQEFVQLCKDADALVRDLVEKDPSLPGKKLSTLRASAMVPGTRKGLQPAPSSYVIDLRIAATHAHRAAQTHRKGRC